MKRIAFIMMALLMAVVPSTFLIEPYIFRSLQYHHVTFLCLL